MFYDRDHQAQVQHFRVWAHLLNSDACVSGDVPEGSVVHTIFKRFQTSAEQLLLAGGHLLGKINQSFTDVFVSLIDVPRIPINDALDKIQSFPISFDSDLQFTVWMFDVF
jgi:hypothetical protein